MAIRKIKKPTFSSAKKLPLVNVSWVDAYDADSAHGSGDVDQVFVDLNENGMIGMHCETSGRLVFNGKEGVVLLLDIYRDNSMKLTCIPKDMNPKVERVRKKRV